MEGERHLAKKAGDHLGPEPLRHRSGNSDEHGAFGSLGDAARPPQAAFHARAERGVVAPEPLQLLRPRPHPETDVEEEAAPDECGQHGESL